LSCKPGIEAEEHEAVYSNRAACLTLLNKFKEAQSDCEQAIHLNPQFIKIYHRLFKVHLTTGELAKAQESMDKCLSVDKSDKAAQ
jgi:Tfp pilus assembly protein PilF